MHYPFFGENRILPFQIFLPDSLYQFQRSLFTQIQVIHVIRFIRQRIFRKYPCNGKAVGRRIDFRNHLYSFSLCPPGKRLPFFLSQRPVQRSNPFPLFIPGIRFQPEAGISGEGICYRVIFPAGSQDFVIIQMNPQVIHLVITHIQHDLLQSIHGYHPSADINGKAAHRIARIVPDHPAGYSLCPFLDL